MSQNNSLMKRLGILPWVLLAIVLAVILGTAINHLHHASTAYTAGIIFARIFVTFTSIFGQFLTFSIPLIIIGLVTPAIADLGRGAGKWLSITAVIAYGSTLFAGFLTYLVCAHTFPALLAGRTIPNVDDPSSSALGTFFTIEMDPPVGVMTALLLSFVIGIGLSMVHRGVLRKGFIEFRAIISALISRVIVPLLPLHIFGLFINLAVTGEVVEIIHVLIRVVVVVLILEAVILLAQFSVAGGIAQKNPLRALVTMLPAYLTALGTSSSAATIPVTLEQTRKNGVSDTVSAFTVPLCATIHLSGSTSKITAFAMAIALTQGMHVSFAQWAGFIFMLGITMVAAPGVPGGAIMAATGILASMLGFSEANVSLMIATYIALDPFGTATNVTGDGAISLIVDKLAGGQISPEADPENMRELSFDGVAYLDQVSMPGVVSEEELAASAAANQI